MLINIIIGYFIIGFIWAIVTIFTEPRLKEDKLIDNIIGFLCNLIAWPISMVMNWILRGLG